jgi:hypothetical protein
MPSLAELQQAFADAVLGAPESVTDFVAGGDACARERLAVYRNTILANYRKALAATYPVVASAFGAAPFHAAVDAFVRAHPSRSGDLNVYGDAFGAFLAADGRADAMPWLPDIARLEWAIDEAHRAADIAPEDVPAALAAVPPERLPALRLTLEPSCRLIASAHPILRIWKARQADTVAPIAPGEGPDTLLVRRDAHGVSVERLDAGEFAWLAALAAGATLGAAIDAAQRADPAFDLGAALRTHIAAGTLIAVDG